MKHKHAEIIKAWADGAEIESRTLFIHAGGTNQWGETTNPAWNNSNLDFRIKPEIQVDHHLMYLNLRFTVEKDGALMRFTDVELIK